MNDITLLAILRDPDNAARILATANSPGGKRLLGETPTNLETFAATHAPPGGVSVGGKEYVGGQFIPGDVVDKATPEEKEAISGKAALGGRLDRFKANKSAKKDAQSKSSEREANGREREQAASRAEAVSRSFARPQDGYASLKATSEGVGDASPEQAKRQVEEYAQGLASRVAFARQTLADSGASESDLSAFDRKAKQVASRLDGLAERHERLLGKVAEARSKLPSPPPEPQRPEEPDEPEEPTSAYPYDEPSREDYRDPEEYARDKAEFDRAEEEFRPKLKAWEKDHKTWEKDHAKWEKAVEKSDADYEKATDRYEAQKDKAQERIDAAQDALYQHWSDDFEPFLDEAHEQLAEASDGVASALRDRYDEAAAEESDQAEQDRESLDEENRDYEDYRREHRFSERR